MDTKTGTVFRPVRGLESNIMSMSYNEGYVYFATDTKKIYIDANGSEKVPMGGNSGIYYGVKEFDDTRDPTQVEFEFGINDIEGNAELAEPNIPNPNDLILNIPDGCFYRVISIVDYPATGIAIQVYKLTIEGSGGGGGGTPLGKATMEIVGKQVFTSLKESKCFILFKLYAEDASGAQTGNGFADLYVNGAKVKSRFSVKQDINTVEVTDWLDLDLNIVKVIAFMDIGGESERAVSKTWTINIAAVKLIWDYDDTKINKLDQVYNFKWTITGRDVKKITYITFDDEYALPPIESMSSGEQTYAFNPIKNPEGIVLKHDAHKVTMHAVVDIEGEIVNIGSKTYNMIFADDKNDSTIISCSLFNNKMLQYDTILIPIIIYKKDNINGSDILLKENGTLVDTWKECKNSEKRYWAYTPTVEGQLLLTVQSGTSEKIFNMDIEKLDIKNEEVPGYAFKFKANDFTSNTAVENWNSNGVTAKFNAFDWINGGLILDENGNLAVCVKAGSSIDIDYKLFNILPDEGHGKTFKMIYKTAKCRDYEGQLFSCMDEEGHGLKLTANTGFFASAGTNFTIPYCEDTYMELEIDIEEKNAKKTNHYITGWLDGVPCIVKTWTLNTDFAQKPALIMTIGSNDCDVYIYLIKVYEKHLDVNQRMSNFIADAPNALEMINRYKRNDILDDSGEISPVRLAVANPDVRVHVYDIPRMTKTKKDPVVGCTYKLYHGSNEPYIAEAPNVTMKVQGTSSAAYGIAAFNLDCKFEPVKDGKGNIVLHAFTYNDGSTSDKLAMTPDSKPVNYFCTKVNVASSEGTNNAINLDWYNNHLPFISRLRRKDPMARDCMFFLPGVVFLKDNNSTLTECDNVFKDTPGYLDHPYFKMYSVGCMGNSKKNIDIFHDLENMRECCIEINDNQQALQWMTSDIFPDTELYDQKRYFEFRYPDDDDFPKWGQETATPEEQERFHLTLAGWRRFVSWMAHSNPLPMFEPIVLTSQIDYDNAQYRSVKVTTKKLFELYVIEEHDEIIHSDIYKKTGEGLYELVYEFDPSIETYYLKRACGYKEAWIKNQEDFALYTQSGEKIYIIKDGIEIAVTSYQEGIEKSIDPYIDLLEREIGSIGPDEHAAVHFYLKKLGIYTKRKGSKYYEAIPAYDPEISNYWIVAESMYGYTDEPFAPQGVEGQEEKFSISYPDEYIFKGYKLEDSDKPLVEGSIITDFTDLKGNEGKPYSIDSENYHMAKMLSECEKYLVMDSVIYHFLFIERHTMIDNVAKNTFWNSSDLLHWDLTKNYDDDTADGNDNSGKLTLTYGLETHDKIRELPVFNAANTVWLKFCQHIYPACAQVYNKLYEKYNEVWSSSLYLDRHLKWQNAIPERCWIEDYYRKYIRPNEVYNLAAYLDMLEGGLKKHQRKQYETYQENYIDSKYNGTKTTASAISCKTNNPGLDLFKNYKFPVKVYADCYISAAFGSGQTPNVHIRAKRKDNPHMIEVPLTDFKDSTTYLYLANNYTAIGDVTAPDLGGHFGDLLPMTLEAGKALRLRELDLSISNVILGDGSLLLNKSETRVNVASPMIETLAATRYTHPELAALDLGKATELRYLDTTDSVFPGIITAPGAPLETIRLESPVSINFSSLHKVKEFKMKYDKLLNVSLNDVDLNIIDGQKIIDSKTIVSAMIKNEKLTTFSLTNVIWDIDDPSEIDTSKETIPLLDTLLAHSLEKENRAGLLTGIARISANAYSGEDTFNIYNKYAQKDKFPNLDLQFEAGPKLHKIIIKNGNNATHWSRKIVNNNTFSPEYFAEGPYGPFNSKVDKNATESHTFVFEKLWIVKHLNPETLEWIEVKKVAANEDNTPNYTDAITEDLIFEPIFSDKIRTYTVTFYESNDASSPMKTITCDYGTTLALAKPTDRIPYKAYSGSRLESAYDFLGYGLTKDTSIILDDNFKIASDHKFYAKFRLVEDIRTVVHPEWFSILKVEYRDDNFNISTTGFFENGVSLTPKFALRGKVTIPNEVSLSDGSRLPVVMLSNFKDAHGDLIPAITHIFMLKDKNTISHLRLINSYCFDHMTTLEYFDFNAAPIRAIDISAFVLCPLINNSIGSEVLYVGDLAFNLTFYSTEPVDLQLPASLIEIRERAFSNMGIPKGSTIIIGSKENPSALDLARPTVNGNAYLKFGTNEDTAFAGIIFYSSLYNSPDDILAEGSPLTVSSCFYNNCGDISVT